MFSTFCALGGYGGEEVVVEVKQKEEYNNGNIARATAVFNVLRF